MGSALQLLEGSDGSGNAYGSRPHIQLAAVTLDTDTTVHTLFGHQMRGRKAYNPKNKGKRSYEPILTFLSETREYISRELLNGDRPTAAQIQSTSSSSPLGRTPLRGPPTISWAKLLSVYPRKHKPRRWRNLRFTNILIWRLEARSHGPGTRCGIARLQLLLFVAS